MARPGRKPRVVPAELPPGDERREAMAAVADELAERVETETIEGGAIDRKNLKVENELAQHFNMLEVSNQDPAYRYAWKWTGQHGVQIKMALAEGWRVVQGDDPEAIELKGMGADTTRRLGDVMLMKMPIDRYLLLQRRAAKQREAREQSVVGNFQEILGPYHQRYGATAIVQGVDVMTGQPVDSKRLDHMWKRSQAAAQGGRMIDEALREGTMPGVPAPGE